MRKIAFMARKGGCAKSTSCVNIAAYLADKGRRVLIVDLDSQGHAARFLGRSVDGSPLSALWLDEIGVSDALRQARENIALLHGGDLLAGIEQRANELPRREDVLRARLNGAEYDYCLIDTPAHLGIFSMNALFFADEVIIPIVPEAASMVSVRPFVEHLERAQDYNEGLRLAYILPAMYDQRNAEHREVLEQIRETWGKLVLPPIRRNIRLAEAAGHGETIFEYDARSYGAQDYETAARRIDGAKES